MTSIKERGYSRWFLGTKLGHVLAHGVIVNEGLGKDHVLIVGGQIGVDAVLFAPS